MNKLVSEYFNSLKDKKVVVLGIGVSNRPLIRMLLSYGIETIACDKMERDQVDDEVLQLEHDGAILRLGAAYLDNLQGDIVFRTPGMHPDIPALKMLRQNGAVVTSEMEVFFSVCPCKIIAVTGSDGKTTTTTLISEMLKSAGHKVWVGGNIGQPLLPLAETMQTNDIAVVELSSFQLMNMKQSPDIAVITNLAPNHLDVHKDMNEYIEAKENIYLHQGTDGHVVLNFDNSITAMFAQKVRGTLSGFSRICAPENGAYYADDTIFLNGKPVVCREEIVLPGIHNVENYMAAICAVKDYVSFDDIRFVARNFTGVEHRIEFVRELNGVRYYNDSIASSPTRTIAGLHAFDQKVILIAGGYDKKIPFDELGNEIVSHVKVLILCGATAEKIKTAVLCAKGYEQGKPAIINVGDLRGAVQKAYSCSCPGDVVTLSPACAAFDQFKNFMVRGVAYKELVLRLQET